MGNYNNYLFCTFLCLLLISCKTEYVEVIPEIRNETVRSVRDRKIAVSYEISSLGYNETGIRAYLKDKPNEYQTVAAVRRESEFYVELDGLNPESTYLLQVYYSMDGKIALSEKTVEVSTLAPFPKVFTLEWAESVVEYNEFGVFTTSFTGDNLNNINLKNLEISLNGTLLQMTYPEHISGVKYKMQLSGNYPIDRDGLQYFIVNYEGKEILRQQVFFRYTGKSSVFETKKTNIVGRYHVSIYNQFYNFDDNKVSLFDESTNRFERIMDIPHDAGSLARKAVTSGDKIFFVSQLNSHILPSEYDAGKEMYSQSYDVKKNELSIYRYGKHNWPTSHDHVDGTIFEFNGQVYQAYTIKDFVNGLPTMPNPQIKNYVARYNASKNTFEDFATFTNKLTSYQFIGIDNELYALGLTDITEQGFTIGFTFAVFKVNPLNFTLTEVVRIGDAKSNFSHRPLQVIEYDKKILIAFGTNLFLYYHPSSNSFEKLVLRSPLPHLYLGGLFKHKSKFYINTDLYSTNATIYEFSITSSQ